MEWTSCLLGDGGDGWSVTLLTVAVPQQLAEVQSMAAVRPHITGAAQNLAEQGEPESALTERYVYAQASGMSSGTLLTCLL